MEVKIINIQRSKIGHSVRNAERHVGIIEKSISHDNDTSNIRNRLYNSWPTFWSDPFSPDVVYIIMPHFFCKLVVMNSI